LGGATEGANEENEDDDDEEEDGEASRSSSSTTSSEDEDDEEEEVEEEEEADGTDMEEDGVKISAACASHVPTVEVLLLPLLLLLLDVLFKDEAVLGREDGEELDLEELLGGVDFDKLLDTGEEEDEDGCVDDDGDEPSVLPLPLPELPPEEEDDKDEEGKEDTNAEEPDTVAELLPLPPLLVDKDDDDDGDEDSPSFLAVSSREAATMLSSSARLCAAAAPSMSPRLAALDASFASDAVVDFNRFCSSLTKEPTAAMMASLASPARSFHASSLPGFGLFVAASAVSSSISAAALSRFASRFACELDERAAAASEATRAIWTARLRAAALVGAVAITALYSLTTAFSEKSDAAARRLAAARRANMSGFANNTAAAARANTTPTSARAISTLRAAAAAAAAANPRISAPDPAAAVAVTVAARCRAKAASRLPLACTAARLLTARRLFRASSPAGGGAGGGVGGWFGKWEQ
jgi:hypothetical protein